MNCDCNNIPSQNPSGKPKKGTFIQLINKKIGKPFVPLIQNNIDLASSTHVNSPIIPLVKPEECILKNKKYQVLISFDKDINGQIYPEWMKKPLINALGDPYKKIIDDISGYIAIEVNTATVSAIHKTYNPLNKRVTEISSDLGILSVRVDNLLSTTATISSLGLVKGSDRINQISVLHDGTMEVNGIALSKISQDIDLILYSPSIEQDPTGENFVSCEYLSSVVA